MITFLNFQCFLRRWRGETKMAPVVLSPRGYLLSMPPGRHLRHSEDVERSMIRLDNPGNTRMKLEVPLRGAGQAKSLRCPGCRTQPGSPPNYL